MSKPKSFPAVYRTASRVIMKLRALAENREPLTRQTELEIAAIMAELRKDREVIQDQAFAFRLLRELRAALSEVQHGVKA